MTIPSDYYGILAQIESGGNNNAQSSTSSAAGRYQFTAQTFRNLGFSVADIFNPSVQQAAVEKLTAQNAAGLTSAGIPITDSTLYAAHFLGLSDAKKVLGADASALLSSLLPTKDITANPTLKDLTVSGFLDWLSGKTGTDQNTTDQSISMGNSTNPLLPIYNLISGNGVTDKPIPKIGWVESIQNFFSVKTGARIAAVVIGIILIGIALYALVMSTDAGKQLTVQVKNAATQTAAVIGAVGEI